MFNDLIEFFNLISTIFFKGGWVGFAFALLYMFYRLYLDHIQITWYRQQKWVFLKITAPRENEKSQLAFEQIFNHLHSIHMTFSWAERFIEGQVQIWLTWEITSIGGSIGNYVKILERHRDTLEAAIYSQYPDAEVTEAEDYFENLPKFHVGKSEYDIFAFSFYLKKESAFPIRTYPQFEHSTAETFVDPVVGLWEALTKLNPYEMFVFQYVFRPVDDQWKAQGYRIVNHLKGGPKKHGGDWLLKIVSTITGPVLDIITRRPPSEGRRPEQEAARSQMLFLTEGEKLVLAAVEKKLSKLGYQTKIHCVYIAPKEKYNPTPTYTAVIGAIKSVTGGLEKGWENVNSLKPDTNHWTKVKYWFFEEWERPITTLRLNHRKRHFMSVMTRRWYFHGTPPYILNPEEIATILHFPSTETTAPQVERVAVTKVPPPPELPIVPQM